MSDLVKQVTVSDKPISKLVQKGTDFKVMAIGLNTGVSLDKHKAPGRAKIFVAMGKIQFKSENESTILNVFDEFDIPIDEFHSVTGLEPSVFLLIIGE